MPSNVLKEKCYWATEDGVTRAELVFAFNEPTKMNTLVLQERLSLGPRVKGFSVSSHANGHWLPIETDEPMTTVGHKRIVRFQPVTADQLRIRFNTRKGPVCLDQVGAYFISASI